MVCFPVEDEIESGGKKGSFRIEMEAAIKILFLLMLPLFIGLGVACQSPSRKSGFADLVFQNGAVWTLNPRRPRAEAVAVKDGKITVVGTAKDIEPWVGPDTRFVDLSGAMLLPGFIDSHTHFLDGGFALRNIRLRDVNHREEFVRRIEAKAAALEEGTWILNGDWDHQRFDPPKLPNRDWIDRVTPNHPVCVNRHDAHMVLVNSAALKIAGITKDTVSPPGGEISKDPRTGEPTGILKDAAMALVTRHIPEPDFDEKLEAAETALRHAARHGITSLHDMGRMDHYAVYRELMRRGRLTARIRIYIPIARMDPETGLAVEIPPRSDFLEIGGLKGFVDGSLGSFTALFFDPYSDAPKKKGILAADMYPKGIMEKRIRAADRAGLQIAVHAIGDRANHIILGIIERIMAEEGERERRWRIEHAQHLLPEDIKRFGRLNLIASVQPYHAIDDGRWAEEKVGAERLQTTYPFRTLLEEGSRLAFGSDWSVAPLDPLSGIYAAATRRTLDGKHPDGWIPAEKISLEDAIRGYTLGGAFAEFKEDVKGSIETGKVADLVVLSRDLFSIPPEEIMNVQVRMTVVGGAVVHESESQ